MGRDILAKKLSGIRIKSNIELFLLTAPALIVVIVYYYLPMFGIVIAFKDYKPMMGILGSPWNGFKNFEFFFRSSQAWLSVRNTLLYNVAFIVLTAVVAVTFAIMLYELKSKLAVKFYQTIFFFPYFLSWVVVAIMLYTFLNEELGILNRLLTSIGFERARWYTEPGYWPFILTFMALWKRVGYSMIIYYAALMGIDPQLYESATIDGANKWQCTFKITLPMLASVIVILMILSIGQIFYADFGLFYQLPLQSGMLFSTTDVINYFTYRALIEVQDYGMAAAVGFFQSIMGFVMILAANWTARRISQGEHGLF
jgi:putative aldouronate transport system permease protein